MDKNKKQIVIMVILLIVLILTLIGILLYYVHTHNINSTSEDTNPTSTVPTSQTEPTSEAITDTNDIDADSVDKEEVAYRTMENYFDNLISEGAISQYNIENLKILGDGETCEEEYDDVKIYASLEVSYTKTDENYILDTNEINQDNNYVAYINVMLSQEENIYNVEKIYSVC